MDRGPHWCTDLMTSEVGSPHHEVQTERSTAGKKKKRKRKTTQAVKTLPTSIKEKRIPRAEAPCIPLTKRNKRKKSMGIRR
eukprot:1137480-Pelagomonas_calceolata.AAC.6